MFWKLGDAKPIPSLRHLLFELTEPVRSTDEWLNYVLSYDRVGAQPWEVYCFTHGLPTRHVGSWLPGRDLPECGNKHCLNLQSEIWPRQFLELRRSWEDLQVQECGVCKQERVRRCQVLGTNADAVDFSKYASFADAPYVHPFNQPKYHALICHAVQFAKAKSQPVLWCIAQDWPLTTDDEQLTPEELQQYREAWLTTHDQRTGGIMGLLPLVENMPVRFTDTVDKEKKVFKHTAGILRKIELEDEEADRVLTCTDTEIVLQRMPTLLQIEISEGHDEPVLLDLKSEYVVWSRDVAGNAKVRRRGFRIIPDFAGTAHAYCGDTLARCKGDLLEWTKVPTHDAMLRAYIIKSRVRETENCLIVRPYSPELFRLGTLPGPHVLLQRQRGDLSAAELKAKWRAIDRDEAREKNRWEQWPWTMQLPCRTCTDKQEVAGEGKEPSAVMLPLKAFASQTDGFKAAWGHIKQGQHLCCPKCRGDRFRSADMLCESCCTLLPASKFHIDMYRKWQSEEMTRFVCRKCSGQRQVSDCHECAGCQHKWLSSAFDDEEMRKVSGGVQSDDVSLQCVRCKAVASGDKKLKQKHKCHRCKTTKTWADFSPIIWQHKLRTSDRGIGASERLACESCQYPPCAGEHCVNANRPAVYPPPHNAFHNGLWYCQGCHYPPYSA